MSYCQSSYAVISWALPGGAGTPLGDNSKKGRSEYQATIEKEGSDEGSYRHFSPTSSLDYASKYTPRTENLGYD